VNTAHKSTTSRTSQTLDYDTWPGQSEIMDEWEWKRSEAETMDTRRAIFYPVATNPGAEAPWCRVVVWRNGDFLFPVEYAVEIWSEYYQMWETHPGRFWILPGETYGMHGFGWSEKRVLRKALRKANGLIRSVNRREARINKSLRVVNL
jgi:hypothetical protein